MHKGVYIGEKAKQANNRILILGESHHSSDENEDYTTKNVIENYRCHESSNYVFFDKIAQSFGISDNNKDKRFILFWEKVYFGNYVDEYCGVKDSQAKNNIRKNRVKYNDELFAFLNDNHITKVFVFSRLVYNNLPSLSKENKKIEDLPFLNTKKLIINEKKDYISHCKYLSNIEHDFTTIELNHDINVYGMRHPSAWGGYSAENYSDYLKKELF